MGKSDKGNTLELVRGRFREGIHGCAGFDQFDTGHYLCGKIDPAGRNSALKKAILIVTL